ncbi:uncharacterized protein TNCV_2952191 [Trichonephila clavipes]|nr:uncharacterized protein TNCV_2952191 [Trichonephila clavipes]
MSASSSSVIPTPLAHADNQGEVHHRGHLHIGAQRDLLYMTPSRYGTRSQPILFYDLLKLNKKLDLGKSEKPLVDHIFVRLESQVQDYVEDRNPQNSVQLLEVLAKFEERYSCKAIRSSRNKNNVERRVWNEHRMSNVDDNRRNFRNSEVVRRRSNGRNDYGGNYENGCKNLLKIMPIIASPFKILNEN